MFFLNTRLLGLDWVQIEISTYCNASCIYCPQTVYKEKWKKDFLPVDALKQVLSRIKKDTYIHLQGWGEPFTHPDVLTMFEIIKHRGFRVGTTTNGNLLDDETMEKLVDTNIDMIAFSSAGASDKENNTIRKGTSLKHVTKCIEKIQSIKARKKTSLPHIHLAQMLFRSSLPNIHTYPDFWKNLGVEQVVLSSLSLITDQALEKQAILADSYIEWNELKERLYQLRVKNGLQKTLKFHLVSDAMLFLRCSENISKTMVIGASGDVTPCVMTNLPLKESAEHWVRGRKLSVRKMIWGNIFENTIKNIWNGKEYKKFRQKDLPETGQCEFCLNRSIESFETAYPIDTDSITGRWQIIHEANKEKQAMERLRHKLENTKNS